VDIPLETFLLGEMLLISITHFIENASFHFGFSITMELVHSTKKRGMWSEIECDLL
jgi:hypothetical protein